MNIVPQYEIPSLLELAGGRIRGRNRADCPDCKRPRSVSFNEIGFCCHGADCHFHGGSATLWKRLQLMRQWIPPDEYRRLQREQAQQREVKEQKERARVRLVRERAAHEWVRLWPAASDHPYLKRKAIPPLGARLDGEARLVIPIFGFEGERERIICLERIWPDGKKRFEPCSMRGGYLFLPAGPMPAHPPQCVLVSEGFATAGSLALATGEAACCVFSCGNFGPALEALLPRMPETTFILAADNDSTKSRNSGLTAAKSAAWQFGLRLVWPTFPPGAEGSDFNDLAREIGIDGLRRELADAGLELRIEAAPHAREPQ